MNEDLKKELIDAGVDYDSALERFVGRSELYQKFLGKFLDDSVFFNLKENLEKEDAAEAFKCAHTLKGLSANLGLNNISKYVIPLVEVLRKGSMEGCHEMFEDVEREYEKVCEIIRKYN